jgi:DNA-binding beta-propeller fold protein YncE
MNKLIFLFSVLFVVSCEKEEPALTPPTASDQQTVYGFNNEGERLYVIDLENGDVTPTHGPFENLYRQLEYITSTNQIISSINGGQGLLTIDCETGLSKTITYSTNMSIERIIVGKNDIIYGYNNDDNRLYIIDLENGDLTPSHGPFEELYWELEYITSTNQIISSINGGQGLITIDCETGLSKKITYSTNMSIERIIVGKK